MRIVRLHLFLFSPNIMMNEDNEHILGFKTLKTEDSSFILENSGSANTLFWFINLFSCGRKNRLYSDDTYKVVVLVVVVRARLYELIPAVRNQPQPWAMNQATGHISI